LVYGKGLKQGVDLGRRETFADLGATIAQMFGIALDAGTSFLKDLGRA
jgi:phosphopentomutase